ncbi:hypothetical protein CYMTET_27161 [Cymbomonas tetramitiformis]|uniref:Uncharacterized protein n=1 Tax=Cymbomonas tetramitiformis TaxID=36881 RepID=A0AAE0FQY1_9CHLO|nr:hypothetical protein CYMTET_27161 [Cymbomonas tetramitiformis]
MVRRLLQRARRDDLTSSSELCRVVGLNFTALMLAMPMAELKKQAAESNARKGAQIRATVSARRKEGQNGATALAALEGDTDAGALMSPSSAQPSSTKMNAATSPLCFERLLGTSLVHAYLCLHDVLVEELQREHLNPASSLAWSCPEGKDFNWFNLMFQEMMVLGGKPGWYLRSQLFNLVLLREHSGGYRFTQDLADTLRAGEPSTSVGESTSPTFDLEELRRTLPAALRKAAGGEEEAEAVWATMLALALYDRLPFKWTMNPKDPPRDRIAFGAVLGQWLQKATTGAVRDALRVQAADQVAAWQDAHIARLAALKERVEPSGAGMSKQKAPLWERSLKWLTGTLFFGVSSHPLVAIYLVKPMEAFSRAERLIVQVNVFIVMLSCCMAFYYSKAITTCVDFQSYVGCPDPNEDAPDCFGLTMCMDIMKMKTDGFFPTEVHSDDFVFTGFPRTRGWAASGRS